MQHDSRVELLHLKFLEKELLTQKFWACKIGMGQSWNVDRVIQDGLYYCPFVSHRKLY